MVNWSIATSMKFLFFIPSQADSAWSVFWTVPYRFGPVSLIDGGIKSNIDQTTIRFKDRMVDTVSNY